MQHLYLRIVMDEAMAKYIVTFRSTPPYYTVTDFNCTNYPELAKLRYDVKISYQICKIWCGKYIIVSLAISVNEENVDMIINKKNEIKAIQFTTAFD